MSLVRPIFLIAGNTITGILRGVVLNVLLVLAALMIIASMSTSAFDPSKVYSMLVDSGLAVITVLGALIAILTGFTMIPSEIEHRTLYPVLAKPVRRWQFVLGKFFGAAGVNAITVGMLSVMFFLVYFLKLSHNRPFDLKLLVAVGMIFFMLTVLSGLIIFFSTFMSWIGTIITSMVIWFIGSYSQFLYDLTQGTEMGAFSKMIFNFVHKLVPNFQAMDLRYQIVTEQLTSIPPKLVLEPLGSGMIYLVMALAAAVLIFEYREL